MAYHSGEFEPVEGLEFYIHLLGSVELGMPLWGVTRVFPDGGSLICYDEADTILYVFAPNQWHKVMNQKAYVLENES